MVVTCTSGRPRKCSERLGMVAAAAVVVVVVVVVAAAAAAA
jgi:hypothetical protein